MSIDKEDAYDIIRSRPHSASISGTEHISPNELTVTLTSASQGSTYPLVQGAYSIFCRSFMTYGVDC